MFLCLSDEAELLARSLGCRLMRASVKEDVNVGAVFRHLASRCLAELHRQDEESEIVEPRRHIAISKYFV